MPNIIIFGETKSCQSSILPPAPSRQNPTPSQRVADSIRSVEQLHTMTGRLRVDGTAGMTGEAETKSELGREAEPYRILQPSRTLADYCRTLLYCVSFIGGLCGSINNVWSFSLLLRRLWGLKLRKALCETRLR
jgi:hypothetical protein